MEMNKYEYSGSILGVNFSLLDIEGINARKAKKDLIKLVMSRKAIINKKLDALGLVFMKAIAYIVPPFDKHKMYDVRMVISFRRGGKMQYISYINNKLDMIKDHNSYEFISIGNSIYQLEIGMMPDATFITPLLKGIISQKDVDEIIDKNRIMECAIA